MITSVRIVSPIIDTPSRMPDANATTAVTAITVGRIAPPLRRSRKNVTPSSMRVCAMTATKNVRPRMKSIVSAWISSSSPWNDSTCSRVHAHQPASATWRCHSDVSRPTEGGDDDERHAVGQRVLVNLVFEGAEDEQAEDRGEQLRGEQRNRQRRHAAGREQQACDNSASDHKLAPRHHDDR